MTLKGKKILLGISGSIAAYKTPELVRLLIKQGAEVQVILTEGGQQFVTPLSLATVSKRAVLTSFTDGQQWHNHVELGLWADLLLIAPCSANTLSKMAHGGCDNLLQATYLSARCPIAIAPAMDVDMWLHPSTQQNITTVKGYNNAIIEPEEGELASGLVGKGRMADPANIVAWVEHHFTTKAFDVRKKALVTAGPTYEAIDPVRFIGNYSTGKMGIAVAEALVDAGYEVDVILGPSTAISTKPFVHITKVTNAQSMYDACLERFDTADLIVCAAAVADFKPKTMAAEKIKKGADETMQIELVKNPDILAYLGKNKKHTQIVVGFALETNNELANATKKLEQKNADYIILNSLNDAGAGFGHDTNQVYVLSKDKNIVNLPLQSKSDIAQQIVAYITK